MLLATFSALLAPVTGALADDGCVQGGTVCLVPAKGAKYEPGRTVGEKDAKKRGKGAPASLRLTVENGRGSVFLNERFVGTAPVEGILVPAGRNDLEVRDGMIVLTEGVLQAPSGAALEMRVRHP
jgi:hypothetical protein